MIDAMLHNHTFDEMSIGETASLVRRLKPDDIKLFAAMSGDVNPAHLDAQLPPATFSAMSSFTACGRAR